MLKTHMLTHSVQQRPIPVYELESKAPCALIIAGVYGDEAHSALLGEWILELFQTRLGDMVDVNLLIVPRLNPDGLENRSRKNGAGVDINRNFPTSNWKKLEAGDPCYGGEMATSEPETELVLGLIRRYQPQRILLIHSASEGHSCIIYDGPAMRLAEMMARENKYEILPQSTPPPPGALSTWCGFERQIPTLTLVVSEHDEAAFSWQENRDAVITFIQANFEQ